MPVTPAQPTLFNTLSRRKEPYTAPMARMYVCGITPDESTHLGHAFTYVAFDVLARYLKALGKKVTYVRNITDVDDDILRKAKEKGRTWISLRDESLAEFRSSMDSLNNLRPDEAPKASEHIASIDGLNRRLVANGSAYKSGGNVYFHSAQAGFGTLSQLDEAEWLPWPMIVATTPPTRSSSTPWTSRSGRSRSPASLSGTAHSAAAAPAGT